MSDSGAGGMAAYFHYFVWPVVVAGVNKIAELASDYGTVVKQVCWDHLVHVILKYYHCPAVDVEWAQNTVVEKAVVQTRSGKSLGGLDTTGLVSNFALAVDE